jgi:hypothetical protein
MKRKNHEVDIMDIFNEHLVKKIPTPQEKMKAFFINFAIGLVLVITFFIGFLSGSSYATIFTIAFMACVAFLIFDRYYWNILLKISNKIEFEYALTNGDLDIDQIWGQSIRKRLLTVSCKNFEFLTPVSKATPNEMMNKSYKMMVDACSTITSPNSYVTAFQHDKLGYTRLVFEPTEKMLEGFRVFIPNKIRK